jgi:YegS/Rv2252/BmrU family lipid kinase
MSKPRFTFIVNPQAGRGNAQKQLPLLQNLLAQSDLDWQILLTEAPEHATEIARGIRGENEVVVAVGGDGTSHEVAAGLIRSQTILSVLPIGSGNDFARLLGFSTSMEENFKTMILGAVYNLDVGDYTIRESSNETRHGIFINSLGLGIDAVISYNSRSISSLRGVPLYLVATLKTLFQFKPIQLSYDFGAGVISSKVFLICVGNGPCEGGGFKLTPNARPNDGRFEICIIEAMPIQNAIVLIPRILTGRHRGFNGVKMVDSTSVRIESKEPFYIHCDGEVATTKGLEVNISIHSKALRVLAASGKILTGASQLPS